MTSAAGEHTWEDAVRSLVGDPTQRELVEACYFDLPLAGAARRYAASPEWAAMRQVIGAPGGVALDIGAGNGIVSYALAQEGWTVIAVEPDPSALVGAGAIRALATEVGVGIEVRQGFGEQLPVADSEAKLVIARQVLHHARDLAAFAREIARVLAPGGRFVSTRDHVISGPEQLQPFLNSHPLHRHYGGENAFTRVQYIAALKGAGLSIEREIGSLESVINYAPYTPETLAAEIVRRLGPLGGPAGVVLRLPLLLGPMLRLISAIDRRPGRLVSFICTKRSD
jgi:SAM-dependent methyltransferase